MVRSFEGHKCSVNAVNTTLDGKYIVSGSDENIKLWDLVSGQLLRTFKGHSDSINSVTTTPDGKFIISGSNDETVKLWDIESGDLMASYNGDDNNWISWKPNGEYNNYLSSDYKRFKRFYFIDDSKSLGEVVDNTHPIYKEKKRDILFRQL